MAVVVVDIDPVASPFPVATARNVGRDHPIGTVIAVDALPGPRDPPVSFSSGSAAIANRTLNPAFRICTAPRVLFGQIENGETCWRSRFGRWRHAGVTKNPGIRGGLAYLDMFDEHGDSYQKKW